MSKVHYIFADDVSEEEYPDERRIRVDVSLGSDVFTNQEDIRVCPQLQVVVSRGDQFLQARSPMYGDRFVLTIASKFENELTKLEGDFLKQAIFTLMIYGAKRFALQPFSDDEPVKNVDISAYGLGPSEFRQWVVEHGSEWN